MHEIRMQSMRKCKCLKAFALQRCFAGHCTLWVKKTMSVDHNLDKYWSIFNALSLSYCHEIWKKTHTIFPLL